MSLSGKEKRKIVFDCPQKITLEYVLCIIVQSCLINCNFSMFYSNVFAYKHPQKFFNNLFSFLFFVINISVKVGDWGMVWCTFTVMCKTWIYAVTNNWLGKCEICGLWGVLGSAWWLTQWAGQEQLPTAVAAALNFPLSSDWWTVYWCRGQRGSGSNSWFHPCSLQLPTSGPTHPHYHPVSLAITEFHCQLRSGQWPVCHYMVTGPGGGGGSQVWNYWPTCSNPCHCWLISGRITEFHQVGSVSVTCRIRISTDPWTTLNPTSVYNSNKLHQFLPIWMGSYPVPTWNGKFTEYYSECQPI